MWIIQHQKIIRKIDSDKLGVSLSVFLEIFLKQVNANAHTDMVKVQTNIHNVILCLVPLISIEISFYALFFLSNIIWTVLWH